MQFTYYNAGNETPDISINEAGRIANELPEKLSDLNAIARKNSDCEQFWRHGFVEKGGYRFELEDGDTRVLVCHTDRENTDFGWGERVVPSADPEIVRAYVKAFEGDEVVWTELKQNEIHTA